MFNKKTLTEMLISEMDQNVKRMSKLIEKDVDLFAKKDEMCDEKRPELLGLVEEFYNMYSLLVEHYDHGTGELRRSFPSDIQSQGSCISEVGSELSSVCPSPNQPPTRRKSGDESSSLDFESESDVSSVVNDDDQVLRRKIYELEVELRGAREKLRLHQEDSSECSSTGSRNGNIEVVRPNATTYEEEMEDVKEKLRLADVKKLTTQLSMCKLMKAHVHTHEGLQRTDNGLDVENIQVVKPLEEELRMMKFKLHDSKKEVSSLREKLKKTQTSELILQNQLNTMKADATSLKRKLDSEEREVLELHNCVSRYESKLSDNDQEIRRLKEEITNGNKSLSEENSQLQEIIIKLQQERSYLENNLKELDVRRQSIDEDLRRALVGKAETKTSIGAQIELLKTTITEKNCEVEELTKSLAAVTRNHNMLVAQKTKLGARVEELTLEMGSKDDRIDAMCRRLHQFHLEQVKLMSATEEERKMAKELKLTAKEQEIKIKQQQEIIQEGAEEKEEAIRQLYFSLDHYRSGYLRIHNLLVNHMKSSVS